MGRKKKRASDVLPPSSPSTGSTTNNEIRTTTATRSTKPDAPTAADFLCVRVKAATKNSAQPRVILSPSDAAQLDVTTGETVLLLNINEQLQECTGVVVLQADILKSSVLVSSPLKKKTTVVTPGTIQLTSASILDVLLGVSATDPVPIVATPSSPSTPSTSNKFSFRVGGGGDKLYTPSPTTASSKQQSARTLVNITIIACRSTLGRRIQRKLCFPCSRMEVMQSTLLAATQQRTSMLARLITAHTVGQLVAPAQVLRISFAGKPVDLPVVRAESTLEARLEQVCVSQEEEDDNIPDEVRSVLATVARSKLRLYEITYDTKIEIVSEDATTPSAVAVTAAPTVPAVRTKQYVAGLDATLEQVRSLLLLPLDRPELFLATKPPRGVLLHGPSGVGKTALARQIVQDLTCRVEYVNCSSLQSKAAVLGQAERELTRLFECHNGGSSKKLLVLDDIHLICPRRGGSSSSGTDRLAATLLALMDGVQSSSIVTLAITFDPSLLDPALRRPGRLDTEVEVPLPDQAATRAEIFKLQLKSLGANLTGGIDDGNNTEWLELAKLAKGFNGADCMLAVKEAMRACLLERASVVDVVTLVSCETKQAVDGVCSVVLRPDHLKAAIRSIKPSAIKSITVEIPQVRWSAIGGMDSVKQELREAIELPITHASYFEQLKVPAPRGILLYGPPGCSKTLMARALATEGNMNFLAVKGPELLSKWLGESERALASLFRRARMASPSIIFFDEIDAIASKRGSGDTSSSGRLLSQLLTELDGVNHTGSAAGKKKHRVVVVGATNRPDLLDSALTRPGRIDRMIYVGVPDEASRAHILELSLLDKFCAGNIDISHLARVTNGFSGAEMVAICRDAALFALEESDSLTNSNEMSKIEMSHLVSAIEGMQRQITPEMIDFYASFRQSS